VGGGISTQWRRGALLLSGADKTSSNSTPLGGRGHIELARRFGSPVTWWWPLMPPGDHEWQVIMTRAGTGSFSRQAVDGWCRETVRKLGAGGLPP
jgi:imidazole glycerol phosphate synthase subunit HisF